MEKKITYREFQKQDTTYVADIIKEAWNYDRLTTPKTAKKLSMLYLYSCLSNQTYTQVALENDIPIGIIMEKNAASHKCPFRYRLKQIGALVSIYLSKEGRKVMKTFESVNHIDKDLIKETGCTYEGEVSFFAVSSRARGKGIGKELFRSLLDYMKSQKLKNFYLFTDTSCNYGFYEHQGMIRRGQKENTFHINGEHAKMSFFLYDSQIA